MIVLMGTVMKALNSPLHAKKGEDTPLCLQLRSS